jgi:aryl-alcohol dehydrogenase-like predicted oxidoreductase
MNLVDTAECYGDHLSEQFIGGAIASKDAGRREDWIIATKFGHTFHGHLNRTDDRSAADVRKQLEDSLKALRTDYIDLYQYHSIRDSEFDNQELRAVLDQAVREGKVRHIGNSISNSSTASDPMIQTEASTGAHVEAIQLVYNRLTRAPEEKVLPSCRRQNLGVLARVPLASGFLSGKYKPGATFPKDDVRSGKDQAAIDKQLREVEQIQKTEVPQGVPIAQWALAWCLKNPAVSCVIPGCKSVDQVITNAKAGELVT